MNPCKNCQTDCSGDYCPSCGQRQVALDRPIWQLAGDVLKETFDLDGRAALTVKTLFRYPGLLTAEFLAGRRQRYTPVLRLYIAISISFFVIVAWLAQTGALLEPGQDPRFDAAIQARFLSDDLPRLMFVLLPVFAVLMKLGWPSRLYFEHLIFSLHLHCAAYVILVLMLPLEQLANHVTALMLAQVLLLVYFCVYFALAVRRVYRSGWLATAGKTTAVLFAYMIVISLVIENTSNFMIIAD